MKIGTYKGHVIAVFLRDEHCPPHVHVAGKEWNARFRFGFLDGQVELWDVDPERRRPPVAILEGIRQTLMQPACLDRARKTWWEKLQTVCLENQSWDWLADEVVPGLALRRGVYVIAGAYHDVAGRRTILDLVDAPDRVEILL
ncbi:DUF4160 domain-containing protein [Pseudomonas sp. CCM 7893]|uniref:DUF4160 domain-containing protein n=1 Tax=Pseudomonas spelaei TaxID=1055469 RepID=A0A6I3W7B4_9PSED|nr:DUF4160 domain-containing protein [Pseudomonas spelaei]MUF06580.1 DUF4160 domain-containing protein [Pseudomonas spelaei]